MFNSNTMKTKNTTLSQQFQIPIMNSKLLTRPLTSLVLHCNKYELKKIHTSLYLFANIIPEQCERII